jgi:ABC-2 type transport system ATP-binding protein
MSFQTLVSINEVSKFYQNGFEALKKINLKIYNGEILALLGPNGAGKTTLINIICGIVTASGGTVKVNGFDNVHHYRKTRSLIGIVPQELTLEIFETVFNTVSYTRGLYGKKSNPQYIEKILKDLSLWDKRSNHLNQLSGGMKRRVLIAKALSHEPKILFLDEPTAGVDVELRKDMWRIVDDLRKNGVTIILTTHYIEEAEAIADRVGVINHGELILVEEKTKLIKKMGQKKLIIDLQSPIIAIPSALQQYSLDLNKEGNKLSYNYNARSKTTGITSLLQSLREQQIRLKDLKTEQSSLESIFVNLVKDKK